MSRRTFKIEGTLCIEEVFITEPPVETNPIQVGATTGYELKDHIKKYDFKHPKQFRPYYLIEKDIPKGTYPKDATFIKVDRKSTR